MKNKDARAAVDNNRSRDPRKGVSRNAKNRKRRPQESDSKPTVDQGGAFDQDTSDVGPSKGNPLSNDPNWYATNPLLVEYSGRMATSIPTGARIELYDKGDFSYGSSTGVEVFERGIEFVQPGIVSIELTPTFGYHDSRSSSLNVAAQATMTWLRHEVNGSRPYNAADPFKYMVASAQILAIINWGKRAYGTIKKYDFNNAYLCDALLDAEGWNGDSIRKMGVLEFAARMNLAIRKIASFVLPQTMTYFYRQAFLYNNVFSDGNTIKDQLYVTRPEGFYQQVFDDTHEASYMKYRHVSEYYVDPLSTTIKAEEYFALLESFIDGLFYSQYHAIISGDFLKAYQGNLLYFTELMLDYELEIQYDDQLTLGQFRNANMINTALNAYNYPDLYEDDSSIGYLICHPELNYAIDAWNVGWDAAALYQLQFSAMLGDHLINIHGGGIDPMLLFEWTRLTTGVQVLEDNSTEHTMEVKARLLSGTEFVSGIRLYQHNYGADGRVQTLWSHDIKNYALLTPINRGSGAHMDNDLLAQVVERQFPDAPNRPIFLYNFSSSEPRQIFTTPCGFAHNVDNYGIIPNNMLANMHDVALMNMVGTEAIALLHNIK